MSRLRKELERCKALREDGCSDPLLSEREQLEHDIGKLLHEEFPEILGHKQKKIRLSYTKTKTIEANPETLTRNRIYTHISDVQITEQIEMLRFQVLAKLNQMNANSLMITSANHREGKTFISTNLAVSIAQNLDRTALLIDADLKVRSYRHPAIADIFLGAYDGTGLSDYLSGSVNMSNVLINPGISRLTLLPKGQSSPDSVELLGSAKMEDLVQEMKSRYANERIILFDCSSFLTSADPLVLSELVDAVLLVVEKDKTDARALRRTIERLEGKAILGTVMNKVR